mgnify:CR=1 FL=1
MPITFRKAWKTLAREVGRPDLHMHDLRHAAAANLLKAGVTLGVAAQVLGHDPAVLAGAAITLGLERASPSMMAKSTPSRWRASPRS